MFSIDIDLTAIEELAAEIERAAAEMPSAISRALNRAGDQTVTAIGRTLAEETGLGGRAVREDIEADSASPGDPVYIKGRQTTLSEFQPRETRRGVSARPWGTRRVFPGTFEARDEVFRRAGRARLPIEMLYGPNVSREAARGAVPDVAVATVAEVFPRRLAHELSRVLKKGGGSGGE